MEIKRKNEVLTISSVLKGERFKHKYAEDMDDKNIVKTFYETATSMDINIAITELYDDALGEVLELIGMVLENGKKATLKLMRKDGRDPDSNYTAKLVKIETEDVIDVIVNSYGESSGNKNPKEARVRCKFLCEIVWYVSKRIHNSLISNKDISIRNIMEDVRGEIIADTYAYIFDMINMGSPVRMPAEMCKIVTEKKYHPHFMGVINSKYHYMVGRHAYGKAYDLDDSYHSIAFFPELAKYKKEDFIEAIKSISETIKNRGDDSFVIPEDESLKSPYAVEVALSTLSTDIFNLVKSTGLVMGRGKELLTSTINRLLVVTSEINIIVEALYIDAASEMAVIAFDTLEAAIDMERLLPRPYTSEDKRKIANEKVMTIERIISDKYSIGKPGSTGEAKKELMTKLTNDLMNSMIRAGETETDKSIHELYYDVYDKYRSLISTRAYNHIGKILEYEYGDKIPMLSLYIHKIKVLAGPEYHSFSDLYERLKDGVI